VTKWRELIFGTNRKEDVVLTVEDGRASVLVDPIRWRILETLGEGRSVTEISEKLEVTDARILYHLRRLAETGVVRLQVEHTDPREWRCLPAVRGIRVREDSAESDQHAVAMPSSVVGQFNQALREAAEGAYGSVCQVSVNHNRARLSEEQASEFSHRLLALIEEYFPPGRGDRAGTKYGFYGVLTPIDLHPLSESGSEN